MSQPPPYPPTDPPSDRPADPPPGFAPPDSPRPGYGAQPHGGQWSQPYPPGPGFPPGPNVGPYQVGGTPRQGPVKSLQICLWVFGCLWTGLGVLAFVGAIGYADNSEDLGYYFGQILVAVSPAILCVIAAFRFARATRGVLVLIRVAGVLFILVGLGSIGNGQPLGLILAIFGGVLLALALQQPVKEYFGQRPS